MRVKMMMNRLGNSLIYIGLSLSTIQEKLLLIVLDECVVYTKTGLCCPVSMRPLPFFLVSVAYVVRSPVLHTPAAWSAVYTNRVTAATTLLVPGGNIFLCRGKYKTFKLKLILPLSAITH